MSSLGVSYPLRVVRFRVRFSKCKRGTRIAYLTAVNLNSGMAPINRSGLLGRLKLRSCTTLLSKAHVVMSFGSSEEVPSTAPLIRTFHIFRSYWVTRNLYSSYHMKRLASWFTKRRWKLDCAAISTTSVILAQTYVGRV